MLCPGLHLSIFTVAAPRTSRRVRKKMIICSSNYRPFAFSSENRYIRLSLSRSKETSEILRDNNTSSYHICRIEEKIIRTATFHKGICNLTP